MQRRDEARKDRALSISVSDRLDRWQHSLHPGCLPQTALRKDLLHIDTQMRGVDHLFHQGAPFGFPIFNGRSSMACQFACWRADKSGSHAETERMAVLQ